ncbi:FeoB-associated Cys-rich membrane protein [bacterium c-19]|nr:FeoB-associated Cys-rich membrane protein [bacterium c-19]
MSSIIIVVLLLLLIKKCIQSICSNSGCNGSCGSCSACKRGTALYEHYQKHHKDSYC